MELRRQKLFDKKQTVKEIDRIVNTFASDIDDFRYKGICLSGVELKRYYNLVKNIPYQRDQKPIEILIRPRYMLKNRNIGLDCKKKTILIGAYLKRNGKRFRYVGSSQRPDKRIHHIYIQVLHDGQWKNIDATYPENNIFENKKYTKVEVL